MPDMTIPVNYVNRKRKSEAQQLPKPSGIVS